MIKHVEICIKCENFSNKQCITTLNIFLLDWHPLNYSVIENFFVNMRKAINFNMNDDMSQDIASFNDFINIHFKSSKINCEL